MKNLIKRINRFKKDQELASKSSVKLKLSPRFKFGPIHLYRKILLGLEMDRNDFFGEKEWTGTKRPKGEYTVTWGEWKHRIKKVCPWQFYFRENFNMDVLRWLKVRQIKDAWYYYKCKFISQYNVVRCNTLPPTWVDEDTLLLHSSMEVLRRFMVQKPFEHHDYSCTWESGEFSHFETKENFDAWNNPRLEFKREITQIWNWWQHYQLYQNELNRIFEGKGNPKRLPVIEVKMDELRAKEDWALQTLIKHRHGLWI